MRSLERAGRGPRSLNCVRVVPAPARITALLLADKDPVRVSRVRRIRPGPAGGSAAAAEGA